ncbi:F-pilin [Streptococcus pneumoniae]|nr:F-pilin [Streptococcus pneumoniae]
MNTVLSVQGASAPVKKKSFFSKFTRLNMLRLVRAVIPVAVLMMLFPELAMAAGKGDLMAKGNDTVKATFGKDSSIVKWVVLAEVLVGAVMYMMTKNVLVGFAILSVFIAVGMSVGKRKANAVCNTCSLQTKLELLLN